MNAVHQFWDTNGAKTIWKVGKNPDYKIENIDLFLILKRVDTVYLITNLG